MTDQIKSELTDIEILKSMLDDPLTSQDEREKASAYLLWTYENFDKQATDSDFDMANWSEPPLRLTIESMKSVEFGSLKPEAQKALDQAMAKRDKIQDDLQNVAIDDDDNPLWNAFEEAKADVERLYGVWIGIDRGYEEE